MSVNGLINYYRNCYQEDSADFNLKNLSRLAKEDLLILSGTDEIASGSLPRLPIPPDYGESLYKRCAMFQRERVLLHCSLFVSGVLADEENSGQLFSPLVFNEASIEKDSYGYYFTTSRDDVVVNEELLALLLPDTDLDSLLNSARSYDASFWVTLLNKSPYDIDAIDTLHFPRLQSKIVGNRKKKLTLMPVSTLAFVERSNSSRGVLHELAEIRDVKHTSRPISELFQMKVGSASTSSKINHNLIPALLSAPQKRILSMAANLPLSAVSGPPGTGKSYTIAAIAAEHCTRGKSVLICAGSETALDVIAEKLRIDFGLQDLFVRAGQKTFLKDFKQYLADLLAGYFDFSEAQHLHSRQELVESSVSKLEDLEQQILNLCSIAIKHGKRSYIVESGSANLWQKLIHRLSTSSIDKLQHLWETQQTLNQLLEAKEAQCSEYLRALKADTISSLLQNDRKSIQNLNKASRARSSAKQAEYFSKLNMASVLKGFPVWLVSLNTLHRVLPLQKHLFDLVVIDEATQCNISVALPALFRAKRGIVVGDQKQLRHFSFLAKAKEQHFANDNDVASNEQAVSYRDNSILDLVLQSIGKQSQLAYLDEHFRSQPELIHFSNHQFYNQSLKVMQHRPCSTSGHIEVVQTQGSQNSAGHNHLEGESIVAKIKELLVEDKLSQKPRSIGVLSLFSKQNQYLVQLIEQKIALADIQKHSIKIATPYGFQGEERDIMLLSFAIDSQKRRAAAYLNKAEVFNVAITRARQKQFLFLSVTEQQLPENNLLKSYLAGIHQFKSSHTQKSDNDVFQSEVISELQKHGISCWQGYEMLGTYIDVLARRETSYLAIDLIGYPGPYSDFFELDSYKVIKRAGVNVFPLSYALWQQDRQLCIDAILRHGFN